MTILQTSIISCLLNHLRIRVQRKVSGLEGQCTVFFSLRKLQVFPTIHMKVSVRKIPCISNIIETVP